MTALIPSGAQAAEDARICTAHLRRGSKSFALAGLLLPSAYAQDATALYAFCRIADDLIDDSDAPHRAHAALARRLDALVAASAQGEAAISALEHPEDRALSRTMHRHSLPPGPIDALLEGFLWDAEGRLYTDIEDTLAYGARVAGSVGVCMAWLMGQRQPAVLARAADLGVAMQLTNIARDVGEDARRGRVYLPQTWLLAHGISREGLLHAAQHRGAAGLALRAVVHKLLVEADGLYERGRSGIDALPRGCRLAIDGAARIYQAIGGVVLAQRPYSLHRRAVVPLWRKLWLLACGACRPGGRRHLRAHQLASPLPAARFLLEPLP